MMKQPSTDRSYPQQRPILAQPLPPSQAARSEANVEEAVQMLKTLAHPLRIQIIQLLTFTPRRSMSVSTLQRHLKVGQTTLSHQLIRMKDRGLLASERKGKQVHYSLADSALSEIMKLVLAR